MNEFKRLQVFWKEGKMSDVAHYLIGNYRYKLYYSVRWGWLMRTHIRQQIEYRIQVMDRECYMAGECKMCGCATTALQMASKQCDKPCYPEMMNKGEWDDSLHKYKITLKK